MGYRVAAHAEGLDGTEIAIETGIDTIEHGMYLNQRPDLLERMAAAGQVLVPTLRLLLRRRGRCRGDAAGPDGAPSVHRRAAADVVAPAGRPRPAQPRAGRPDAEGGQRRRGPDRRRPRLGTDQRPRHSRSSTWSTTASARPRRWSPRPRPRRAALGLGDHVGTIEPGRLADLLVTDGDPLERPGLLRDRDRIWLVLQLGTPSPAPRWSATRSALAAAPPRVSRSAPRRCRRPRSA